MTERRAYTVAIVGATGVVGGTVRDILEERDFPVSELRPLASSRSRGAALTFKGASLTVGELAAGAFAGVDLAFFAAGGAVSQKYVPQAVAAGAVVIDKSSAFRADPQVPLVVPEVNAAHLERHRSVIATPNCSTIQMVVALKPLDELAEIKRVVVSTYQAASGAGAAAMEELYSQSRDFLMGQELHVENFAHRIAFNCIPQIDVFLDDGSTKEEWKMVAETKKIMHLPDLKISATCVRVPVLRCHSESINVEFAEPAFLGAVMEALDNAPGLQMMDDPATKTYPMPGLLEGTDDVYVGRLRRDDSVPYGFAFWCVADQLRKGAALNAVQIAEALLGK